MNTGSEVSLERLRWRCRRGMLELDLLLEAFLDRGYVALDELERQAFAQLLSLQDQELFELLINNDEAEKKEFSRVIEKIRYTATP